jgi:hypothetical protein
MTERHFEQLPRWQELVEQEKAAWNEVVKAQIEEDAIFKELDVMLQTSTDRLEAERTILNDHATRLSEAKGRTREALARAQRVLQKLLISE